MIGEKFPTLPVRTTKGKLLLPHHYAGKWIVLFIYPSAFAPTCTTELIALQKKYKEFKEENAEIIGCSINQVITLLHWIRWIESTLHIKIEFPIIGDARGNLCNLLNIILPKDAPTTIRSTIIVDGKGIIKFFSLYPREVARNVNDILRVVKILNKKR